MVGERNLRTLKYLILIFLSKNLSNLIIIFLDLSCSQTQYVYNLFNSAANKFTCFNLLLWLHEMLFNRLKSRSKTLAKLNIKPASRSNQLLFKIILSVLALCCNSLLVSYLCMYINLHVHLRFYINPPQNKKPNSKEQSTFCCFLWLL